MRTLLGIAAVAATLTGCSVREAVHTHAPIAATETEAAVCRVGGEEKTLATGASRPFAIEATAAPHAVALSFVQVPFKVTALELEPSSLDVGQVAHVRLDENRPAPRLVPHLDSERLELTEAPRENSLQVHGENATLAVRVTEDGSRLEWLMVAGNLPQPGGAIESPGAGVRLRNPSAIALPDGRFAIAFLHICSKGRAAMLLTLDETGHPLGEPMRIQLDAEPARSHLTAAADGRALLAYMDIDGKLRAVPISCGAPEVAPSLATR
jgi:hypothetical protein